MSDTERLAALLHEKWTCPHGHDRLPYSCHELAGILIWAGVRVGPEPPTWTGDTLRIEGKVEITQTDTDPGDMGEPRVVTADGVTVIAEGTAMTVTLMVLLTTPSR